MTHRVEVNEQNIFLSKRFLAHVTFEGSIWIKILLHGVVEDFIYLLGLLDNVLHLIFGNCVIATSGILSAAIIHFL